MHYSILRRSFENVAALLEERDPEKPGQRFTRRIYLFTKTGLKEATKGHDFEQVREALKGAGAFFKVGQDGPATPARTPHGTERLYYIDPSKLE
jgi:putative DNA primase/helicase